MNSLPPYKTNENKDDPDIVLRGYRIEHTTTRNQIVIWQNEQHEPHYI